MTSCPPGKGENYLSFLGYCCHVSTNACLLLVQMSVQQLGYIPSGPQPMNVTGQMDLTQGMTGPYDNGTYLTRGYTMTPSGTP